MSACVKTLAGMLAILLAAPAAGGTQLGPLFEPACLPWTEARYVAEKFFLRMELEVEARLLDDSPVEALWPVEGRVPLMPGERTLSLAVVTRGPGRRFLDGELLLDATTGAVLQYASLRGPEPRHRVYRFTASGPQRRTARPLPGEEQRAPPAWSDVDVRQRHYAVPDLEAPVVEVSTLLYLVAASGLRDVGDVLRVNGYATSVDQVYDVTATVGEPLRQAVNYRQQRAAGTTVRRDVAEVLPIRIQGRPYASQPDAPGFEILGLNDVEFLLEPRDRVVVAVRARVAPVGEVEFRLQTLALTDPPAVRCPRAGP